MQKGTRRQASTLCPQLGQYAQATPLTGQPPSSPSVRSPATHTGAGFPLSLPVSGRGYGALCPVSSSRFPSRLLSPRPLQPELGGHSMQVTPPHWQKLPVASRSVPGSLKGTFWPYWSKPSETVRGRRTSRLHGAWPLAEDADRRGPRPGLHCPLCLCPSSSASYRGPVIGFSHPQTV